MSFFNVDGWRLPIKNGSALEKIAALGEVGERWTNAPSRARRGLSKSLEVASVSMTGTIRTWTSPVTVNTLIVPVLFENVTVFRISFQMLGI